MIFGIPGMKDIDMKKVEVGNRTMRLTSRIIRTCVAHHVPVGLENPAGSFIWQAPPIACLLRSPLARSHCFDMCPFGAPWRKRTRVVFWHTSDVPRLHVCCQGRKGRCSFTNDFHIVLQGNDKGSTLWTKRAEAYPKGLASILANTLLVASDTAHLHAVHRIGGAV